MVGNTSYIFSKQYKHTNITIKKSYIWHNEKSRQKEYIYQMLDKFSFSSQNQYKTKQKYLAEALVHLIWITFVLDRFSLSDILKKLLAHNPAQWLKY